MSVRRPRRLSSRRVSPARQPALARLPFIVAAFVLVSQLFSLSHLLLVSHIRCEHGELVHAAHFEADSEAPAAGRTGSEGLRQGTGFSAEHEHCDPFAVAPSLVAASGARAELTLLDAIVLPWSVRPAAEQRAIGILSFAPKSSPPV